jgi:hypothetical protein
VESMWRAGRAAVPLAEIANPGQGNEHHVDPDAGDIAVDLLAQVLGPVEVIAIGPPDGPLPVAGHCSRCGTTTTVYGPAGHPLCDQCTASPAAGTAKEPDPA